jgi:adenine-specific DNA-methyltransferase
MAGPKNPYVRYQPLKKPPLRPMTTTMWDYPSQHYGTGQQGSQDYKGATPGWVVWQVVTRFTKEGHRVLDPFCGSGTTLDVCKDFGRDARGFDIAPAREDVERGDARRLPLPDECVDLVFMDPPYADNLRYSDDPACIGRLKADDGSWHEAMEQVFAEVKRVLLPGRHLAVYVCDVWKKSGAFHSLGADCAALGRTAGFRLIDHVAVVRHNKDLERGNYQKAAEEQGFLLRGFNHLLFFEKPRPAAPQERPTAKRGPPRRRDERGGQRKKDERGVPRKKDGRPKGTRE